MATTAASAPCRRPSGNIGASWSFGDHLVPYVNVSTSFETPTTTELVNQPDGSGGFNQELGPQRAVNYEIGARGRPLPNLTYSIALFLGRVTDAIVQQEEVGGRAFFRNVGKTHNDGAEIGINYSPIEALTLQGAYTRAHYRFAGSEFDGNRLPGVPDHFWRFGIRTTLPRGFFLDADQTLASSVPADDANTIIIDSWDAGVTNLRLGWQGSAGSLQLGPFLGVNNLWDRAIHRLGHIERRGWSGDRAVAAPSDLRGCGDRISDGVTPARLEQAGGVSIDYHAKSPATSQLTARRSARPGRVTATVP